MADQYVALAIDLGGANPARAEIVAVAALAFGAAGEIDRLVFPVHPRGAISAGAFAGSGLTRDMLDDAPTWPEVAPALRRLVAGRAIVGWEPANTLLALESAGVVLPNAVLDARALCELLFHGLPALTLPAAAVAVGAASGERIRVARRAEELVAVFRDILGRIERFDAATLEQLAGLLRLGGVPEAELFARFAAARPTGPLFAASEPTNGPHELAFLTARERTEGLRPTGSRKSVAPKRIAAALAEGGPLSHHVAGYELRPPQERMAVAVADALNDDGRLLVEAGTGTGKSLAYLLPAALHAIERGETVVVSTNTLALQDQLFRKDLPDLHAALGEVTGDETPFTATVLKGRVNYLCLRSWFQWLRQPVSDAAEARLRAKIVAWLTETATGDRAELRLAPDEQDHWRHVAEEEGSCVPSRCPFQQRNQCFLFRARRRAEAAHLVIVNHALLLSDVAAGSRILPAYERLVIDEAHHLEDQATTQFGFNVTERDIAEFADAVARRDGTLLAGTVATCAGFLGRTANDDRARRRADDASERVVAAAADADSLRAAATRLFARFGELVSQQDRGWGAERSLRLTPAVRHSPAWDEVELLLEPVATGLHDLDARLRWLDAALAAGAESEEDESDALQREELGIEVGLAIRAGTELASRLRAAVSAPDPAIVYWIERWASGDRSSLHAAPLLVGEALEQGLFGNLRTLVLTSATLTTDDSFAFVQERLGLDEADTLAVASPFDYERSTLLYLADDMPEPNHPAYQRALEAALIAACTATKGRALVLFTSHAALQATARGIAGPLREHGIATLAQRLDGSPQQLIERLRHEPSTVVLGTATFWEGVDIVGPALSLLAIAKLPFSVPSDPVFAARSELFENPFADYAVPQAVLRFKQGFGRLIRSGRDRGVCAVLDRRMLSKRYGGSFVQSLPSCSVQVGSAAELGEAAARWLDDH
jgi:DNA polymerase-3 subunit epsilon/ATP-dependent DNA helicase DinG